MSGRSTDTTWDDVKALLGVDEDVPLEQSAEYVDELRRLRDGRQIQAAREAAGLTQTDLARLMGTSQSHVARLETGVTAPTVPTLERISDATGTTFVVTPTPMWDRGPVVAGVLFRERSAADAIASPQARRRRTRAQTRSALLPGAGAAALLTIGATPHGRREIAAEIGRTEGEVLDLVTRADRMRVRGVGAEHADLLRRCGCRYGRGAAPPQSRAAPCGDGRCERRDDRGAEGASGLDRRALDRARSKARPHRSVLSRTGRIHPVEVA